jgi:threonine/homoserine/homoserine lactone efflux protein
MEVIVPVISILAALSLGVISPGPSFLFVARVAVAESRVRGLAAALGMGAGGLVLAMLAMLGLHIVLASVEWLYMGLRVLGGVYLVYIALRLWRSASEPVVVASAAPIGGLWRAFLFGLGTQLSNPKAAVIYASVFAALLPRSFPAAGWLALLPLIFLLEAGWYAAVALAFSSASSRNAYLRAKRWIDRAAAVIMGALGAKLVIEAAHVD